MASEEQVKRYIAYWLQLGKKVLIHNGDLSLLPQTILAGERYSQEFEHIWRQIISPKSGDCYLEGTNQTIAELLTSKWIIEPCVRCEMPVPLINIGVLTELCPCNDLPTWPNTEIPLPREPISSHKRLQEIRDRLYKAKNHQELSEDTSTNGTTDSQIPCNRVNSQRSFSEIYDQPLAGGKANRSLAKRDEA